MARVFASEKNFEAARAPDGSAFAVAEHMKLVVGVQACWLLVGMHLDPFRDAIFPNVSTIIVYPGAYWSTQPVQGPGGVVTEGRANLGEAHDGTGIAARGPVLLSWPDALEGGRNSDSILSPQATGDGQLVVNAHDLRRLGHNLVLHEFAHKLDMLDGVVDGTPPIPIECAEGKAALWSDVMNAAFSQLRSDAARGSPTILDTYGAQNPGEFFAVSVEMFFMQPRVLAWRHPELFEALACVFGWRG
jgi:Mlc titration factor MtfA (ptsG expression regulator)